MEGGGGKAFALSLLPIYEVSRGLCNILNSPADPLFISLLLFLSVRAPQSCPRLPHAPRTLRPRSL